jgi:hypothetical protein
MGPIKHTHPGSLLPERPDRTVLFASAFYPDDFCFGPAPNELSAINAATNQPDASGRERFDCRHAHIFCEAPSHHVILAHRELHGPTH